MLVIPELGRKRQAIPFNDPSQSSLIGEFQTMEEHCLKEKEDGELLKVDT